MKKYKEILIGPSKVPFRINLKDHHAKKMLRGVYETEVELYESLLRDISNPVVFDGGANIGFFTILFYSIGAEVHAFEPVSDVYNTLLENTAEFVDKVTVNKQGLSDSSERFAEITVSKKHSQGSSFDKRILTEFPKIFGKYLEKEKCELITVDEYCQNNYIKKIDLLKLDIEGNELKTILGAERSLSMIKNIVFESHFDEDTLKITKILERNNFFVLKKELKGVGGLKGAGPTFVAQKTA